jgi:hypothetical protein
VNERAQLALDASLLSPGTTVRMVCPFCGGGSSKEASLALTHSEDGSLLFYCHRAHCTARGVLGGSRYTGAERASPQRTREWDLSAHTQSFPVWVVEQCQRAWGVDLLETGWLWDNDTGRIIMPVAGARGQPRGHIARLPPDYKGVKSLRFAIDEDAPWACWYATSFGTLVVVEDIPSAYRISRLGMSAVALCGTRMGVTEQEEIADATRLWGFSKILVALDKDAARLTFHYAKDLLMRGLDVEPLLIEKDFKNMTDEEIRCTVSNAY